jgi:heat shock protein HslJ
MFKKTLYLSLLTLLLLSACAPMVVPNPNQPAAQPSATPTLPPSGAVGEDFIGSEWRLTSLNGPAPVGSQPITLIFRNETELGGTGGCNGYFGTYTLQGETFTASGLGSTMMACGEEGVMEQESAFLQLLNEGGLLARNGDELTLTTASGVLKFERVVPPPPAALEGTLWQLEAFGTAEAVSSLLANTVINAAFKDGGLSGYGGCNNFGGSYTLNGTALQIGELIATEMWCTPDEVSHQEQSFTAALLKVTSFTIEGNQLTLTHPGGTLIFRATPALSGAPFVGTAWKLVNFETASSAEVVPAEIEITATFAEGKINGSGGCNNYFGEYIEEAGRITVAAVGATKMACEGKMDLEQRFFTEIAKTHSVILEAAQLRLVSDGGTLVFEAIK